MPITRVVTFCPPPGNQSKLDSRFITLVSRGFFVAGPGDRVLGGVLRGRQGGRGAVRVPG